MALLDWKHFAPVNNSQNINQIQQGNQQMLEAIKSLGGAFQGYSQDIKQQNTDDILQGIMAARNPNELVEANAAAQEQMANLGRAYNAEPIRTAMDNRVDVLNKRASDELALDLAQKQAADIPLQNQAVIDTFKNLGIDIENPGFQSNVSELLNRIGTTTLGQRNTDASRALDIQKFQENVRQFNTSQSNNMSIHKDNLNYKYNALTASNSGSGGGGSGNQPLVSYSNGQFSVGGNSGMSTTAVLDRKAVENFQSPIFTATRQKYDNHVSSMSEKYGVPKELIWAVMSVESGGNETAKSETGVKGLMQVTEKTFNSLKVGNNRLDPQQSIEAGTKYLSQLLKDFNGDYSKAIVAYNSGPGNVKEAVEKYGESGWIKGMRAEGQDYLPKIQAALNYQNAGYSTPETGPSSAIPADKFASVKKNLNSELEKIGQEYDPNMQIKGGSKNPEMSGKSIRTWVTENHVKDSKYRNDIVKSASKVPGFLSLPTDVQYNILNDTLGWTSDMGFNNGYSDANAQKHIANRMKEGNNFREAAYKKEVSNAINRQYNDIVLEYEKLGQTPPPVQDFVKAVNPEAYAMLYGNNTKNKDKSDSAKELSRETTNKSSTPEQKENSPHIAKPTTLAEKQEAYKQKNAYKEKIKEDQKKAAEASLKTAKEEGERRRLQREKDEAAAKASAEAYKKAEQEKLKKELEAAKKKKAEEERKKEEARIKEKERKREEFNKALMRNNISGKVLY